MPRRFQFSLSSMFAMTAIVAVAIQLLRYGAPFGIWVHVAILGAIIYNAVAETAAGR